jgi:hypothetical protein
VQRWPPNFYKDGPPRQLAVTNFKGLLLAETPPPLDGPTFSLAQAAQLLGLASRTLANMARQHGFCMAIGRDLVFSERHIKSLAAMIRADARAERRAAIGRKKTSSTFGIHESGELRKQRRRAKKRQSKKDA